MRPTGPPAGGLTYDSIPGGVMLATLDALDEPLVLAERGGHIRLINQVAERRFGRADRVEDFFRGLNVIGPFAGWPAQLQLVFEGQRVYRVRARQAHGGGEEILLRCERVGDDHSTSLLLITWTPVAQEAEPDAVDSARRFVSLGRLAARVAHELNNPLDGVLRYINLALRVSGDAADSSLGDYLKASRTGLMRMRGIIGDLLAFSRAAGEDFEEFALAQVIEQALQEASAQRDVSRVVMAVDLLTQELPAVRGRRLFQVFGNLFANALDAMPGGGRLMISAGLAGGFVVIRVADTGTGLPEPPERVFEPFYTTKPPGKGTGLGLAICKEMVQEMKGAIRVCRGPEGGAEFTVSLPVESFRGPARVPRSGEQG